MGDGGAMFLGFLMAFSRAQASPRTCELGVGSFPILILGATIFDTTLITISRSRRGLSHLRLREGSHRTRLANLWDQRGASAMYSLGAVSGGTAILELSVSGAPLTIAAIASAASLCSSGSV